MLFEEHTNYNLKLLNITSGGQKTLSRDGLLSVELNTRRLLDNNGLTVLKENPLLVMLIVLRNLNR